MRGTKLGRRTAIGAVFVVGALIAGPMLMTNTSTTALAAGDSYNERIGFGSEQYFAKYDGIDGESNDASHDKWIDVLSIDWGAHKPTNRSGQSRRRGTAKVEDFVITTCYGKSTPKLVEKLLRGEVIPKLEIEVVSTRGETPVTYLKYELKNVQVSSYQINGSANAFGPPTVVIANNFEEIKAVYTEHDEQGSKLGNVEYTHNVERGGR